MRTADKFASGDREREISGTYTGWVDSCEGGRGIQDRGAAGPAGGRIRRTRRANRNRIRVRESRRRSIAAARVDRPERARSAGGSVNGPCDSFVGGSRNNAAE